jgi:hypothetical protein
MKEMILEVFLFLAALEENPAELGSEHVKRSELCRHREERRGNGAKNLAGEHLS